MYGKLKCDIVHLSFSLCVNQLYPHWISALPAMITTKSVIRDVQRYTKVDRINLVPTSYFIDKSDTPF